MKTNVWANEHEYYVHCFGKVCVCVEAKLINKAKVYEKKKKKKNK